MEAITNNDAIFGSIFIPEYCIKILPPTPEQIRAQKISEIKNEIKLFLLHLLGMIGYTLSGSIIITFIKWMVI